MSLRSGLMAVALAFGAFAPAAQAATYALGGSGGNLGESTVFMTSGAPNVTVTAGATGLLNFCGATIRQTAGGLGVDGCPDTQPTQVDGNPLGSSETLTFVFDWAVNLLGFGLSDVDGGIFGIGADQYDISINNGGFVNGLTALANNAVNWNYVTSFTIRASGSFPLDGDDFKVSSITVSSVPLPAGGLLLLGGLGAVAALRRRKTA